MHRSRKPVITYDCLIWTQDGKVLRRRFAEPALIEWLQSRSNPSEISIKPHQLVRSSLGRQRLSLKLSVYWKSGETLEARPSGGLSLSLLLTLSHFLVTPPSIGRRQ